ncbi:uncharacterized protein SOCE836_098820 [Sorangium cellulosum]|uniref:Uncharacterized protein n=1 Tax=Sorangium cellulosum TaxID=56 RepID=A0A4V0NHS1_SORCE|nr:uncharacterized protein SOCE836_098820 [Sorangium cellulosum]WCQ96942.1 hypothetical protein NQZ70_09732 [Sorangium sp. Soce836]
MAVLATHDASSTSTTAPPCSMPTSGSSGHGVRPGAGQRSTGWPCCSPLSRSASGAGATSCVTRSRRLPEPQVHQPRRRAGRRHRSLPSSAEACRGRRRLRGDHVGRRRREVYGDAHRAELAVQARRLRAHGHVVERQQHLAGRGVAQARPPGRGSSRRCRRPGAASSAASSVASRYTPRSRGTGSRSTSSSSCADHGARSPGRPRRQPQEAEAGGPRLAPTTWSARASRWPLRRFRIYRRRTLGCGWACRRPT